MSTASPTHPVTPEEIMALLDGELSPERAQAVSVHTECCDTCQKVFASLLHTGHSLTSWTVGQAPDQIGDRVLAAAKKIGSSLTNYNRHEVFTLPKSGRNQWILGLTACAGVFLLIVVSRSMSDRPATGRWMAGPAEAPISAYVDNATASLRPAQGKYSAAPAADSNGLTRGSTGHAQNAVSLGGKPQQQFDRLDTYAKIQRSEQEARISPMIARTVSLMILVKDFDANRKALDAILVRYNGYAANLTVSTPQGAARSLEASLRIPAPQLPAALAELKALGHVENENQNGEEVTQQHADLVARLKNSRATEERLQAILTQRTGKISDVLEVEQEIARVRGEIEQMEAEQKNLEHRVDFATIDLKLSEEYKAKLESTTPSFSTQFHNALVSGYRNVADTLVALILFFAEYGPILLFWIALLGTPSWLVWRRWRQVASPALSR